MTGKRIIATALLALYLTLGGLSAVLSLTCPCLHHAHCHGHAVGATHAACCHGHSHSHGAAAAAACTECAAGDACLGAVCCCPFDHRSRAELYTSAEGEGERRIPAPETSSLCALCPVETPAAAGTAIRCEADCEPPSHPSSRCGDAPAPLRAPPVQA